MVIEGRESDTGKFLHGNKPTTAIDIDVYLQELYDKWEQYHLLKISDGEKIIQTLFDSNLDILAKEFVDLNERIEIVLETIRRRIMASVQSREVAVSDIWKTGGSK